MTRYTITRQENCDHSTPEEYASDLTQEVAQAKVRLLQKVYPFYIWFIQEQKDDSDSP